MIRTTISELNAILSSVCMTARKFLRPVHLLSPRRRNYYNYYNYNYYKECFDAWSELNGKKPSSSQDVVNEIIWNNKFFCIEKMSLYRKDLIDLGFLKIGDVISINNFFSPNVISPLVSPEQRFFLMSIVNSIPAEWRALARASGDESPIVPLPNTPTITMDNDDSVPILDVSSKQIYQSFLEKKQIPPSAKKKLVDKYPDTIVNWENVYSLAFCTTLE